MSGSYFGFCLKKGSAMSRHRYSRYPLVVLVCATVASIGGFYSLGLTPWNIFSLVEALSTRENGEVSLSQVISLGTVLSGLLVVASVYTLTAQGVDRLNRQFLTESERESEQT